MISDIGSSTLMMTMPSVEIAARPLRPFIAEVNSRCSGMKTIAITTPHNSPP